MTTIILSSDTHVIEPPDLYDRIEPRYRDRAPRLVADNEGNHYWWLEDRRLLSVMTGSETGKRFDDPSTLRAAAPFEDVRLGGYLPDKQLEDNEQDGVWGSVLYPTLALQALWPEDEGLLAAMCRAYNDWLAEFCSYAPDRLKGVALISLDDVDASVDELTRTREAGLAGAAIPVGSPRGRSYGDAELDPFWAAAQDLDVPISLHIGGHRTWGEGVRGNLRPSAVVTPDYWQRISLCEMVFGGVFRRFEHLHVGSVECELAWIPYFLERMDYIYTQTPMRKLLAEDPIGGDMLPSDVFRRNIFASFQQDALGIEQRQLIGIDGLTFGSDYPHPESTFPQTRTVMDGLLADVPQHERDKLLCLNVARLYHFDVDTLERLASARSAA
jgi:predicted TIM-barrel fold metal-dependent hydrolase